MTERLGRPVAKYRVIADHFRSAIAAGDYQPGDQLPSQGALESDFDASMGTVVRALEELRREGLVETRHGAGTFVLSPPDAEPSEEFRAVMERLDEMDGQIRLLGEKVAALEADRGRQSGQ